MKRKEKTKSEKNASRQALFSIVLAKYFHCVFKFHKMQFKKKNRKRRSDDSFSKKKERKEEQTD